MDSVEVICVEIQENENGEIVYVEKMDNGNSDSPGDFCVMECEIATSEDTSSQSTCEDSDSSPVEIIVFPDFSDKFSRVGEGELAVIKKEKAEDQSNLKESNSEFVLRKDERFANENDTKENFDIVLKLAMRSDSDNSGVPGKVHVKNIKDLKTVEPKVKERKSVELQKNKLWTLLDTQDKCNAASSKRHITTTATTGSLDVRRTYSGILPRKSCVRENHNDLFSQLPFRCKVCDQCFRQDSSLKIHLKVHAGKYSDSCIIN